MSVTFSLDLKSFIKPKAADASSGISTIRLNGDNGRTVILIHGLTGTPNEMRSLAGYLNRKGYSVICPALAGHGKPLSILKHSKWQDFYESVREVMSNPGIKENPGPVFTAGLSAGALLALLLAEEFKDKICGASCLAPTLYYDGWNAPYSKYLLPLGYYTPLKYFFYFKEDPPYGIKNEAIRQRIHKYYENAKLDDLENVEQYGYPYFPVTLLYQLQLLVRHVKKRLPGITFPVQLIQAKDDDMASIRNSKVIYDTIKSGMKEMVLLYNSYHVITADHERETVAEKMENFFSRIAASEGPLP